MPRSRTSRSSSPQTQRPQENSILNDRERTFQNVREIFQSSLDDEIIRMVLIECNWKDDVAIDKLLAIAADAEAQKQYKQKNSQLRKIAEGVLGPISFEDYKTYGSARAQVIPDSKLTPSQRIIGRPIKSDEKTASNSAEPGAQTRDSLIPRGHVYSIKPHENQRLNDKDFPKLPSKSKSSPSSAFSSEGSQSKQAGKQSNKQSKVLLQDANFISQAQSAYNQQYDDAASAQRWEEYKQRISEHYVENLGLDNKQHYDEKLGLDNKQGESKTVPKVSLAVPVRISEPLKGSEILAGTEREKNRDNTSAIDKQKLGIGGAVASDRQQFGIDNAVGTDQQRSGLDSAVGTERQRSGRSFPVRLLNKEIEEEKIERNRQLLRLDSADLDETIFKSIYDAPASSVGDGAGVIADNGSRSDGITEAVDQDQRIPTPSSLPMTLPVIGLSVEAEEFVPRPKPAVVESKSQDSKNVDEPKMIHSPVSATTDHASKPNRSTPIEIQPGARNIKQEDSADVPIGSPLQISPALSPGLAQPISPHGTNNSASLAGSPVFLTYKWPHGLQCVSATPTHQPPILTSSPHYVMPAPPGQPHLPPTTFRLRPGPPTMSFPNRVVYPMAPPPFYRMGVPHHPMPPLRPPTVPVHRLPSNLDERAAYATGQSIMTADTQQKTQNTGKVTKIVNPSWITQCQQKITDSHKNGKKVLVIVRGLPGSGKSTLSRNIKMDGIVLSTDDYFMKGGYYSYNPDKLPESHKWNRERAREAMKMGTSPIIIDNTNTQKWEFNAYLKMGMSNNYHIEIMEPDTPWKFKPAELAKRTVHGVPKDHIQRMLNRYERNITVESMLGKGQQGKEEGKKSERGQAGESVVSKETEDSPDKSSDDRIVQVKEQEEESVVPKEDEDSPDKSSDDRMWDISETKSAHLSRSRGSWASRDVQTSVQVKEQEEESVVSKEAEDSPDKSSDDRMWDISEMKAAHLSRNASPISNNSRGSSSDRQTGENASRLEQQSNTPNLTDDTSSESLKETIADEDDLMLNKEVQIPNLNVPPPSIKFDKSNNTKNQSVNKKNNGTNVSNIQRKIENSEEYESKMAEISSKLSPDTLNEIDDMLEAHVKDVNLSEDMLQKREEELGALLQLLPIDVEEIIAAEEFIHLKLKSYSLAEENDSNAEAVEGEKIETTDHCGLDPLNNDDLVIFSEPLKREDDMSVNSKTETVVVNDSKTDDGICLEKSPIAQNVNNSVSVKSDKVDENVNVSRKEESDILEKDSKDVDHSAIESELEKIEKETNIVEESSSAQTADEVIKDSANEHESVVVDSPDISNTNPDIMNTNQIEDNVAVVEMTDIEKKYWGKVEQDDVVKTEAVESKWENSEGVVNDWDGERVSVEEVKQQEMVKPQRVKKIRHVSNSSSSVNKNADDNDDNQMSDIQSDDCVKSVKSNPIVNNDECTACEQTVKSYNAETTNSERNSHKDLSNNLSQNMTENDSVLNESISAKQSKDNETIHKDNNKHENEDVTFCVSSDSNTVQTSESVGASSDNVIPSVPSTALDLLKQVYSDGEHAKEQQLLESIVNTGKSAQNCSTVVQNKCSDEQNQNENNSTNNNYAVNVDMAGTSDGVARNTTDVKDTQESDSKQIQSEKTKRKTSRKIAAKFPEPLISVQDKEKFLSKDWSKLAVTQQASGDVDDTQTAQSGNLLKHKHTDASTMTCDEDFRDIDMLNKGGFIDSSLKYLIGSSKKTIVNNHHTTEDTHQSSTITKVHLIHQSTSTEDLKDMSYSESVKFLKTCFPNVREDELECVLVNCNDNVEWSINLLLDWKYSLHLTDEEKEKFVSGMDQLKSAKPVKQPSALTDLCFQLIEKQKIASREEIEEQLIETSKERLDRIEDENITKIRLRRSSSLNESADEYKDGTAAVKPSPRGLKRSQSDSSQQIKSPITILNEIIEEQEKNNNKTVSNTPIDHSDSTPIIEISGANKHENKQEETVSDVFDELQNENFVRDYKMEKIKKKIEMKEHVRVRDDISGSGMEADSELQLIDDRRDGLVEIGAPAVTINLSTDVIKQLEGMFGPIGDNPGTSRLPVSLDHTTALRLYQCIKHGVVSYSQTQLQLQEDAEMARRLQDEENAYASNQSQQNGGSRSRPSRPPIRSLHSIMREEEAEERKKQEFNENFDHSMKNTEERGKDAGQAKMLEHEGGPSSMSTRVKRLQLYDKYPTVDRPLIDRIYEANCFNMSETEDAIKWSLGHSPGRSRTNNNDLDLDKSLIESTKQQSMQEMLDSYIYMPHVTKDYQDGIDPDYEDYRGEANLHYRLRHECFQKAQAAFRQGLKQVASFYSQQGHLHTQKIKEANMRASEQILADRNADLVRNGTLDLHGLHIDEAIAALNRILPDLEQDYSKKSITIITGRGSHSKGGIARLRPSVIAYLKRFHFTFSEEQTGVIKVSLKHRRKDK